MADVDIGYLGTAVFFCCKKMPRFKATKSAYLVDGVLYSLLLYIAAKPALNCL